MKGFKEIIEKVEEEIQSINKLIKKPNFDSEGANYKLRLHFQIIKAFIVFILKERGL